MKLVADLFRPIVAIMPEDSPHHQTNLGREELAHRLRCLEHNTSPLNARVRCSPLSSHPPGNQLGKGNYVFRTALAQLSLPRILHKEDVRESLGTEGQLGIHHDATNYTLRYNTYDKRGGATVARVKLKRGA
eukprot:scaffold348_cov329-Pavlova_lutheri.AAC.6